MKKYNQEYIDARASLITAARDAMMRERIAPSSKPQHLTDLSGEPIGWISSSVFAECAELETAICCGARVLHRTFTFRTKTGEVIEPIVAEGTGRPKSGSPKNTRVLTPTQLTDARAAWANGDGPIAACREQAEYYASLPEDHRRALAGDYDEL